MTLNGTIILKGVGLHSGQDCELVISPSESPEIIMSNGIHELPLRKFKLSGTNRGSDYIFSDDSRIRTCEHVLSGLAGLGIWSGVKLTVKGGEMPALDGCSKIICDEIMTHSDKSRENNINALEISEPVIISSDDKTRFIAAFPCENLHITYTVEYKYIGAQIFDYDYSPENYFNEIASARTFAYESDINYLRSHNMALGGSLDNAVVIAESGIKASGGLRYENEFVRHKILDLTGDLAAIGRPLKAHIIAVRAGHELHLKLAQKLRGD